MIRAATKDDVDCIAKLRNDTWKTAYKGIVSDQFLSKLDNNEKAKRFCLFLGEKDKFLFVYSDNRTNQICGYVQFGKPNEFIQADSEIYALYVLDDFQRQGIGKALMLEANKKLKENGNKNAIIWVFSDNFKARAFYEKLGGLYLQDKLIRVGSDEIKVSSYLFTLT